MDRLEKKGLIDTWMGDPTPQRGGRSKRIMRVTAKGAKQAAEFYRTITEASKGIAWKPSAGRARS